MHVAWAGITLQLESMLHNHISGAESRRRGFYPLEQSKVGATQEDRSEMNCNPVRGETLFQDDVCC